MFRSFIYLDSKKMYSYFRQIDSLYVNNVKKTISKKKTRTGSLEIGPVGLNSGVETKEQMEVTEDIANDYNVFEKKLEALQGEEYFDFVLNDYDIKTVPNMSIIRLNGSIEIPEQFDIFNMAQNFMPLIMNQIETDSNDEKELMEAFFGKASADIPIVMDDEEISVAGKLNISYLEEEYAELEEYIEQEVYILCKVIGKINREKVEIFNPLKDFIKLPRAIRRSMDSDSEGLESIEIEGPVLKVEIIAIYK